MDAAHLHLMLNHFPIAGIAFSIPLLFAAWWFKREHLRRAALALVVVTGLLTIPTFLTGEPAEEIIEHLPGVSEQVIKVHEEAAETALIAVCLAAFVALAGLILALKKKAVPAWAIPAVTVLALVSGGLLAWTNNLGGQIRHTEIRSGAHSSQQ